MGVSQTTSGSNGNEFDHSVQPLLEKPEIINGGQIEYEVDSSMQSTEASTPFRFNYGPRPCRDVAFAIIFLFAVVLVLAFGVFAVVHHNSDYKWIGSAHFGNNTCSIIKQYGKQSRSWNAFDLVLRRGEESKWARQNYFSLWGNGDLSKTPDDPRLGFKKEGVDKTLKPFLVEFREEIRAVRGEGVEMVLLTAFAVTLVLCGPLVLGLLWLLKTYVKVLVYLSVPFFILVPVALDIVWFVTCLLNDSCHHSIGLSLQIVIFLFVILVCGIFAWIIYANWDRVELTIKIIRTASEALRSNLSLLFVLPGLTVFLLVFFAPVITFMVYAYMNGRLVPNPELEEQPSLPCGKGFGRECCVWQTEGWVSAYQVLAAFTLLWSAMVIGQVQNFTISCTVSQWYFAQIESSTRGFIQRSLGHAFGPSFGTCCFSGLVFAFVRLVRAAVDNVQNNRMQEGVVIGVFRCCLQFLLQGIEFLSKFTLNFAAITGESYCASAVMTYNLLRRNLLSPVFVEIISSRLLGAIMFFVSVVYAFLVFALLRAFTDLGTEAFTVTVIIFAFLLFILVLLVGVLDAVIDTVYVCYAMDKDQGTVSKSQVHDVYVLLPLSQNDTASLAIPGSPV